MVYLDLSRVLMQSVLLTGLHGGQEVVCVGSKLLNILPDHIVHLHL